MSETGEQALKLLDCEHTMNFANFVKFGAKYDRRISILKKMVGGVDA